MGRFHHHGTGRHLQAVLQCMQCNAIHCDALYSGTALKHCLAQYCTAPGCEGSSAMRNQMRDSTSRLNAEQCSSEQGIIICDKTQMLHSLQDIALQKEIEVDEQRQLQFTSKFSNILQYLTT